MRGVSNSIFVQKIYQFPRLLKNWLMSSWTFFKNEATVQDITVIDIVMQCASFSLWNLYLTYTAIRCGVLSIKFFIASFSRNEEEKLRIWRQVQLYTMAKVIGIIFSQTVLVLIGISSLGWALCVLLWGAFLSSLSLGAYYKSRLLSQKRKSELMAIPPAETRNET